MHVSRHRIRITPAVSNDRYERELAKGGQRGLAPFVAKTFGTIVKVRLARTRSARNFAEMNPHSLSNSEERPRMTLHALTNSEERVQITLHPLMNSAE
jgi:hypothetical protein